MVEVENSMLMQCLITVNILTFEKLLLNQCSINDDFSMLKCPTIKQHRFNSHIHTGFSTPIPSQNESIGGGEG